MHTAPGPADTSALPPAQTTPYVWMICLIAACGGLLFGYDWVVIGGAAKFYEAHFQIAGEAATWSRGWAQSCALLGCLLGSLASGYLCDRGGRRPVLLVAAVDFVISSIGIALADSFTSFWLWRILGGVGIGLASNVSPLYIAEIAPARMRGMLVALNQLTIVIGILAAQIVNWLIAGVVTDGSPEALALTWNATQGWRWMFAACTVPSLVFLAGALAVPESPRWLARAGRLDAARAVLARVGGEAYAQAAMGEIGRTVADQGGGGSGLAALCDRRVLLALALGCFLAAFQQWCGINVIFNYAGEIFAQAGYGLNDTMTNIVATGVVNLVFTFVAIGLVDRLGRRALLLTGAAALAAIYLALGACYAAKAGGAAVPSVVFLGLVLAAIGAYAMSLAPVVWVVVSEIFPNRIRGTAMSVAVGVLWIACFLLTVTFPALNQALGPAGTFWCYAGICAIGFLVILFQLQETKGRSLEEIERRFAGSGAP